jgi:hypothetical protein
VENGVADLLLFLENSVIERLYSDKEHAVFIVGLPDKYKLWWYLRYHSLHVFQILGKYIEYMCSKIFMLLPTDNLVEKQKTFSVYFIFRSCAVNFLRNYLFYFNREEPACPT